MTRLFGLWLALAAGVIAAAQATNPPAGKSAFDKPTLEAYARHLFLWGTNINVAISDPKPAPMPGYQEVTITASANNASQSEVLYISQDGRKIVRGAVYDVDNSPFADELTKLKTDLSPSMGTPGAPILLVMFSDFECGYCKQMAKTLHDNLLKSYPKEVRLYFKDFPIDSIHPWARSAAIAGRCVFRQNPQAFWDYHDWIFDKQESVNGDNLRAKVMEWAGGKNLDTLQLGRCFDGKSPEPDINKSIAEAQSLRVNSTPTLFLNGRTLPGSIPWPTLKQIIDLELDYTKRTGLTPEKCCEIKLSPLPGSKN